jgi:hypothetical protein
MKQAKFEKAARTLLLCALALGLILTGCDTGSNPGGGTTPLATPANVRVDDAGKTAFTLKWDAVAGADSYTVDIDGILQQVSASTTSYDLKTLTADPKVYPVRIRALAANSDTAHIDSEYSAPLNVEPAEYIFTYEGGPAPSPSIQQSRSIARAAGEGNRTITGLTQFGKGLTKIVVPSKIGAVTVTAIGANAFKDNTIITEISLPETITAIGDGAFSNITVLIVVVFTSPQPPTLGNNVFEGSTAIETITVPSGSDNAYTQTIGENAPSLQDKIGETGQTQPTAYTISLGQATNGTITTSPTGSAQAGTTVTITGSPDQGYILDSVSVYRDNSPVSTQKTAANEYTFTMPDSDVLISGVFEPTAYTISLGQATEGKITTNPSGSAVAGTSVTIISNAGYAIQSAFIRTSSGGQTTLQPDTSGVYSFTMPDSNVTVNVIAKKSGPVSAGEYIGTWTGPGPASTTLTINTNNTWTFSAPASGADQSGSLDLAQAMNYVSYLLKNANGETLYNAMMDANDHDIIFLYDLTIHDDPGITLTR